MINNISDTVLKVVRPILHYIPPIYGPQTFLPTLPDHTTSSLIFSKKSLKIPKGQSESVYLSKQTTQWPKEKSTKGQTMIYKAYIYKTKDRVMFVLLGLYLSV